MRTEQNYAYKALSLTYHKGSERKYLFLNIINSCAFYYREGKSGPEVEGSELPDVMVVASDFQMQWWGEGRTLDKNETDKERQEDRGKGWGETVASSTGAKSATRNSESDNLSWSSLGHEGQKPHSFPH